MISFLYLSQMEHDNNIRNLIYKNIGADFYAFKQYRKVLYGGSSASFWRAFQMVPRSVQGLWMSNDTK